MLNENNLVSKSKTIIDLKNLDLNLQELKVLDVYLSKINPKNIDTAKVRFTKKEYCDLISVNSNWLKTKRLSKYLQHLFNNSVVEWLDDEQENFKLHHLFEEAEYDKTTQEIILECGRSDYVRSMFFDINTCGYIKYALKNTLYLKSTYSIKQYISFIAESFIFVSNFSFSMLIYHMATSSNISFWLTFGPLVLVILIICFTFFKFETC